MLTQLDVRPDRHKDGFEQTMEVSDDVFFHSELDDLLGNKRN